MAKVVSRKDEVYPASCMDDALDLTQRRLRPLNRQSVRLPGSPPTSSVGSRKLSGKKVSVWKLGIRLARL